MSYDSDCLNLAIAFINDASIKYKSVYEIAQAYDQLAQEIQNTIEGFLFVVFTAVVWLISIIDSAPDKHDKDRGP